MTNEELIEALLRECPIRYEHPLYGIFEYKKISAIICRIKDGKIDITAELMDKNNNSVIIVYPDYIEEVKL